MLHGTMVCIQIVDVVSAVFYNVLFPRVSFFGIHMRLNLKTLLKHLYNSHYFFFFVFITVGWNTFSFRTSAERLLHFALCVLLLIKQMTRSAIYSKPSPNGQWILMRSFYFMSILTENNTELPYIGFTLASRCLVHANHFRSFLSCKFLIR